MQANNIFDPRRFWLLLKEEIHLDYRRYLLGLGAAFALLAVIWWFNGFDINVNDHLAEFHYIWFGIILIGGGAFFTSIAYVPYGEKTSRLFYLNLPASTLEKFASKWFITAILYPLAIWLFYLVFSWVVNAVYMAYTGGTPFTALPAFGYKTWLFIRIYIVVQSLFLLGAVIFHRFAIFKTGFSLLLLGITLGLFTFICFRLIFPEVFDGLLSVGPYSPNQVYEPSESFKTFVETRMEDILTYLFWIVPAPVLLIIGYYKLKEKEV